MVPPVSDRENKKSFDFNTLTLAQQRACVEEFRDAFNIGVPDHMRMVHAHSPEAFGPGAKYRVYPLNDTALAKLREDENLYYCVGAVTPYEYEDTGNKGWKRRVEDIGAGVVVGFDDIGTKTMKKCGKGLDFFEQTLPPTAVIETSPGNFQLLYFLAAPILDSHEYGDVLRSIIKPLSERYGIDKLADVNRVLRLPFGINNKTLEDGSLKYPDEDGNPWRVRLVYADYDVRYSPEEIATAYELEIVPTPRKSEVVRRVAGREEDSYKAAGFDLIAEAYTKAGRAWSTRTEAGRKYRICCPFEGEHASGGMNDDAFIADPTASKNGYFTFGCSHGSCNRDSEAYAAGRRTFAAAMEAAGVADAARTAAMMAERAFSEKFVREMNEAALWADGMTVSEWIEILKMNAAIDPEPAIESGGDSNMSDGDAARESAQSKLGASVDDDEGDLPAEIKALREVPRPTVRPGFTYSSVDFRFEGGKLRQRAGVHYHGYKSDGKGGRKAHDAWVCSPLEIKAITRSSSGDSYGRLIRLLDGDGRWVETAVPMKMLAADPKDLREMLLDRGVVIDRAESKGLEEYLMLHANRVLPKVYCAPRTGWYEDSRSFVLPSQVIGDAGVVYQSNELRVPYDTAGSFDGWKANVAALAVGNPAMILAMSVAFAGTLLRDLNMEGAGFHLFGASSGGKTTVSMASLSAWGGPGLKKTWNNTANAIEAVAANRTDTLLLLDEIGQVRDVKVVDEAAYSIVNGVGRGRSSQRGNETASKQWRVCLLSNGEKPFEIIMAEGGLSAKAGQEVRLANIPVNGKFGVFDDLHGRESGNVLSDDIKRAAATDYGWAGPAFVAALLESRTNAVAEFKEVFDRFEDAQAGQEKRVASSFALVALAGELAIRFGVVPWPVGAVVDAALSAFALWKNRRPSKSANAEFHAIWKGIVDFVERNGESRFSDIRHGDKPYTIMVKNEAGDDVPQVISPPRIANRAGYFETIEDREGLNSDEAEMVPGLEGFDGERKIFAFIAAGFSEATKGYDREMVRRALDEVGAVYERNGKPGWNLQAKVRGENMRLHFVDVAKLRIALGD